MSCWAATKEVFCPSSTARSSATGGKFVQKYHLPSASSVVSAVKGLLEKDFITQTNNTYYVYDRFFQLWLEKK